MGAENGGGSSKCSPSAFSTLKFAYIMRLFPRLCKIPRSANQASSLQRRRQLQYQAHHQPTSTIRHFTKRSIAALLHSCRTGSDLRTGFKLGVRTRRSKQNKGIRIARNHFPKDFCAIPIHHCPSREPEQGEEEGEEEERRRRRRRRLVIPTLTFA